MEDQKQTAAALLDVQRACWLYIENRTRSPREALYEAGTIIDADHIARARRKAAGWDRAAASLIAAWLLAVALLAVHLVALVAAAGHAMINSKPVLSGVTWLAPSGLAVLAASAVLFGLTLLSEHRTLLADRAVMEVCEADRLCAVAWEFVEIGQLPAGLLVTNAPRFAFMSARLWQHVRGVDEQMLRVLAAESNLSVAQLRQAVALLS